MNQGYDAAEQELERRELLRKNSVYRFWLKEHESKKVVFLDDVPATFYEHNLFINGRWGNYFTCIGKANGCPLCMSGHKPSFVGVFTIIDRSEYKDKKGVMHTDTKRLYAVRAETLKMLKEKKDRWGSLTGFEIIISRKGSKDANCGSDFERVIEGDTVKKPNLGHIQDLSPINYAEVLAPMSKEELKQMVGYAQDSQQNSQAISKDGKTTEGADDVPF
jgi:hypothetical protein